jgi:hypothetical protein
MSAIMDIIGRSSLNLSGDHMVVGALLDLMDIIY